MIYCQCGDDSTLVSAGIHTLEFTRGYLDLHHRILCSLLDFTEQNRPVFYESLMRRQRHDHRDTPIVSGDGNRCIMEHGVYEGSHLSHKALDIALYEEVERQIAPNTVAIADDGSVRIIVISADSPCTAQQFHTLVVAIGGMTAITDCTDHAVSKLQRDDRSVHISHRSDGRIVHDACLGKHLLHFIPDQKTSYIEVMDRHIENEVKEV